MSFNDKRRRLTNGSLEVSCTPLARLSRCIRVRVRHLMNSERVHTRARAHRQSHANAVFSARCRRFHVC